MNRAKLRVAVALVALLSLNLTTICWSLNSEGMVLLSVRHRITRDPFGALSDWRDNGKDIDRCSWSSVECRDGQVISLNLKDLQLEGTLSPEIGKLTNLRSMNRAEARSGSSYRRLLQKELPPSPDKTTKRRNKHKNNGDSDSAPSPSPITNFVSISVSPESSTSISVSPESSFSPSPSPLSNSPSPSPELAPIHTSEAPTESKVTTSSSETNPVPTPSPSIPIQNSTARNSNQTHRVLIICVGVIGGLMVVLLAGFGIVFFRNSKMVPVKPWATGLSGQLQKAFVTGVPKLNRTELEAACEDFSNIIGNLSDGTVYKGTLSSGVEIAVTSTAVASREDWSKNAETQFRNKIDTLSKLNHKNFVNLIGFCEEDKPNFTRMLVFEYAPNGTLFEHLHIKESEQLDWGMRLRIAMGIAYCLDYIHQLTPAVSHRNLNSSSIQLTEDYAAKVSDFSFWNDLIAAKIGTAGMELLETAKPDPQSNIHSFGLLLFEMITGRIPYSMNDDFVIEWASRYIEGHESGNTEMVDPTLKSFDEDTVKKMFEAVKACLNPDLTRRPTMMEVTNMLKEITAMEPEAATPKLSPLWWAELEIMTEST